MGEEPAAAIYFEGALYMDTLPLVPLYTHRFVSDIPHFSYSFEINEKVFVSVSPEEHEVLSKSGLRQNEIELYRDMQSERGRAV